MPVSDASVEINGNATSSNVNGSSNVHGKNGFDLPLLPGSELFRELAEQGAVRVREGCERMKAASGELSGIARDAYASNARGAADYGAKVIEISGQNADAAFDFLVHLLGSKSLAEAISVSAEHGRKNFAAVSAQNKELLELARKLATESAEPMKQGFAKVLQKAS
jgi:phasin